MNEGTLLVSTVGSLVVLGTAYLTLQNTILDITHFRDNPWSLVWYSQVFLILIPLTVVGYIGIDNVSVLHMAQPGLELPVAIAVISTLLIYVLSLAFCLRFFGLYSRRALWISLPQDSAGCSRRLAELSCFLCMFGLLLLTVFHFLGYKHAFFFSLIEKVPLIRVRLANAYSSRVLSQVTSMLFTVGYLLAVLSGYMARYRRIVSLKYLAVALLLLAAPGNKALLVQGVLLWILANGKVLPRSLFSIQALRFAALFLIVALGLAYCVVRIQVPDISVQGFGVYLLGRLGVGQMAGVYETAALIENGYSLEGEFFWHMVPFSRFFVDYTDYQKYLMMISEGYGFTQMGVKNSYFLAEAYAIGGPLVASLSPVIVAFSTSLGLLLLTGLFKSFFGRQLVSVAVALCLVTHDITGGFSSFPMLKGCLNTALQLGTLGILWSLWKAFFLGRELYRDRQG